MDYNNGEEENVIDRAKKVKLERDQELEDIKAIMGTPEGLRFFKRFMADGHMFRTTFTGNSATFFNEGARNLMLKYFRDICEARPDKVIDIIFKDSKN